MAERDLEGGANNDGGPANEDWDAALNRLLEGVNLDELSVPTTSGARRNRLTFDAVRARVAEQLREKLRTERQRRESIERLERQFEAASVTVDQVLAGFGATLLDAFNGGGEAVRLPDARDGRSRTWQVLGYRSPGRTDQREPVVTVLLTKKGVEALDRGQPALECRVSTPRNPRLVDFTAGTDVRDDLEDAVCRAYQDILGTLRFDPSVESGVNAGE
ncbi:MAG TPA: hypothetical protein VNM48_19715 [Chloroflexota bacterium]|nr:hypothetical protein [Chloroflexota bacterium]